MGMVKEEEEEEGKNWGGGGMGWIEMGNVQINELAAIVLHD